MDLKQLQSFVSVVNLGSFTKAAEQLYISQPTISSHIRMLEEEYDSCFLVRTTKQLELTPRGRDFYEYAVKILEWNETLKRHWNEEDDPIISLGASTIPSTYLLPDLLKAYKKEHADTIFHIHQSDSDRVITEILNGTYHLGFTGMKTEDSRLAFEPFYMDTMVLITADTPYFRQLKTDHCPLPAILKKEPLILREQGSGSRRFVDQLFQKIGLSTGSLNIVARLNEQESIKNLVAQEFGISVISKAAASRQNMDQSLLLFELPDTDFSRELYLVHHKNYDLNPRVLEFKEFAKHFFSH